MSKRTKGYIIASIAYAVLGLPSLIHLGVNYYWWLFDGNILNADKMEASAIVVVFSLLGYVFALLAISELRNE